MTNDDSPIFGKNASHPSKMFKYCPFCGSKRFVWDGKKMHFCQDCGHQLYSNSAAAVIAVIENNKGELLMVRRRFEPAKGMLDLPGGFVDMGESAEAALRREVKEEVNLDVVESQFVVSLPNTYIYNDLCYFTTDLAFRCKVASLQSLQAHDDAFSARFYPLHEIRPEEIGLDSIRKLVMHLADPFICSLIS